MRTKVSIIGAGNVGASTAQLVARDGIADVVLFDVVDGVPQGKALDLAEACALWGSSMSITGTNDLADVAGSDIIVVTAGFPRKPGMSRDDLLVANAAVVKQVVEGSARRSPEAVYLVVTNPMDVMAHLAWKVSGFDSRKVIGMGGVLDSARFRTFVSFELGISPADVEALVMGGHGDQMVPMPRYTTVKGVPITRLLPAERVTSLIGRTRQGGAEIVSLLKTGSAYYAPAAATYEMIRAIIFDEKRIVPCAAYLGGEYGVTGLYVGVPVVLGRKGIERIVELELNEEEKSDFEKSVSAVKPLVEKLGI